MKKKKTELLEEERIKKELEVIRERYDDEVNGKKKKIADTQEKNEKQYLDYIRENEKDKKNNTSKKKGKIIDFDPVVNKQPNQNANKSFEGIIK